MSKTIDVRVQDSKEWIIKALEILIVEKNYEDILIKDIIEKSGVSKSTFHRHFSGKDSVLEALIEYNYAIMCKRVLDIADSIIKPEDSELYISESLKNISEKPELFTLLTKVNRRDVLISVIEKRMHQRMNELSTEGINLEELEYKVMIFLTAFISTAFIYLRNGKHNHEEVAKYFITMFKPELTTKAEILLPNVIIEKK